MKRSIIVGIVVVCIVIGTIGVFLGQPYEEEEDDEEDEDEELTFDNFLAQLQKPTSEELQAELLPADETYQSYAEELAKDFAQYSHVSEEEILKELLWFVVASRPYRGATISYLDESADAGTMETGVGGIFENLTGIKVDVKVGGSTEVSQKVLMEIETKAGYHNLYSVDGGDLPALVRRGGFINIADFAMEHPETVDPWFDFGDIMRPGMWNAKVWKGYDDIRGLPHFTCMTGCMYRRDLVQDPTYKEEFEARYGYELKDPWEYIEDFYQTGDPQAGWTTDKVRDMVEFFNRPEEGLYGCYIQGNPAEDLIWAGTLTTAFGMYGGYNHPEKGWNMDLDDWWVSPKYWGEVVDKETGKITSVSINNPAGLAFLDFYRDMFQYAPSGNLEKGNAEVIADFTIEPNAFIIIAPVWELYYVPWWTGWGNPADACQSLVDGTVGIAPFAVNAETWEPDKHAWGWDDMAYMTIPEGTPNKAASLLYLQFTLSKPIEAYKIFIHNWPGPARVSVLEGGELSTWADKVYMTYQGEPEGTIQHRLYQVYGKETIRYGDIPFIQQYLQWYSSDWFFRSVTEDSSMVDYMPIHSGLFPTFHTGLTEDWPLEEWATELETTLWNIAKNLGLT